MTDKSQDLQDRARDLQLDAMLHEAAGVLPAPGLADRIVEALHDGARHATIAGRCQAWLAAAIVILALGVGSGIAWLQNGNKQGGNRVAVAPIEEPLQDPKPKPQNPKPAPQDPPPQAKPKSVMTLIADYSYNRVYAVNEKGKIVLELNDIFGAWDAEMTPNDTVLVTEFSVSRVNELNRNGISVWTYEDLKNPYDADFLPNGNILITDTFAGRVIEVKPDRKRRKGGKVVWSYNKDIRPFDADRLANGNTLISDVLKDRVIEVNPAGKIVWQKTDLPNIHDADRLPNGNTLVTLRNKGEVREIDPEGVVVWLLEGLKSPSDADRLPSGNTLVAENTRVREFDKDQKVVWKKETSWAVEVNRYVVR